MKNQTTYPGKPFFVYILILISSFSVLLYLNATYGKFVYDDFKIIVENCFIKEWKYFPKIFTKEYFTISGEMSYRPIVTITYFIDYAVWHSNPFGFHLTNIILHTLNAVLFYLLLNAVLQSKKIVLFSTLFFVTHLALLETVNAVGYREDLLSATFLLVSLIYFIKSDNILYKKSDKRRFTLYYAISLTAYLCALFSKEMAITFPVLLVLFVIFSDQKIWPCIVKRFKGIYTGYMAISLFYLIIRFIVFRNHELKVTYQPGGFCVNTFTMIKILASYIKISFFPFNLNADYVVPLVKTPFEASFILSITFLISIFIIFAILIKSRNAFACWMAWFFIMILPVMNILPIGNIMAERYLYIPVMGFCVVKGILIYRITDRTLSPRAIPLRRMVQLALVTIMIGGYGFSIIRKNGDWRDEFTLWAKTIQRSPNSHRAHCNLGNVYMESGLIERAQMEYQTALNINPKSANSHSNLGTVYSKQGNIDKAFIEYKEAIQLDSDYAQPHNNLGNIYFNQGHIDKARAEYEEALRIKPNYSHAHNGLGSIYDAIGELDKAMEEFKKSLYYDNRYIHAINNLGVNYAKRGLLNESIAEFKKGIKLDTNQAQSHYNLGLAYEKLGKTTDAIHEYNTVIQLDPNNSNAHYALGTLYQGLGLADKAIDEFQKIVVLYPNSINVYKTLAFLYLDNKKDKEMSQYYLKELLRTDPSQAQKEDIKKLMERLELSHN
ncbi:MAG TPA: tetratricopeptide repeat protein [Candidatus Wunengus sp. YC60]|uniref:tetratricopeptide repeat protein n=1 Tax=Candidatus Wunengus sp. YC60 TaxID=3367697 RepID=UPI0040263052